MDPKAPPRRADTCLGGAHGSRQQRRAAQPAPREQALLRYFLSSEGVASSSLSPRAGLDALAAMAPDLVIADAAGAHGCVQLRQRLPEARIVALAEAGDV